MVEKAKGKVGGSNGGGVLISALNKQILRVCIQGDTPLIVNRFNEKIKRQLADKHTGGPRKTVNAPRVPEEEYESAFYKTPNGEYAICASGIKKAMIAACTSTNVVHVILPESSGDMVPAYPSMRATEEEGRSYRGIEEVMGNEVLRGELLSDVKARLVYLRKKYRTLSELANVWEAVDKATG